MGGGGALRRGVPSPPMRLFLDRAYAAVAHPPAAGGSGPDACTLVRAAHRVGVPWFVENPADCGEAGGAAWWPAFASHAPLWLYPPVRAALEETGAQR
eukprot:568330-Pleurochrysis_carterae.AAC.1